MSSHLVLSVALMVVGLGHVALSMNCVECVSKDGLETTCDSTASNITCQEERVNTFFEAMQQGKPSLKKPPKNSGFQCLAIRFMEQIYYKGCFYDGVDLCAEFSEFPDCKTCKKDYCNAKWYKESQDGAAAVPEMSFALVTGLAWVCVAVTWLGQF